MDNIVLDDIVCVIDYFDDGCEVPANYVRSTVQGYAAITTNIIDEFAGAPSELREHVIGLYPSCNQAVHALYHLRQILDADEASDLATVN